MEARLIHSTLVHGVDVDDMTRCRHYAGPSDIIAMRFRCCDGYYSCHQCHEALAHHVATRWKRSEYGAKAILCGACGGELTIEQYMASGFLCPACGAMFNAGCKNHYDLYFQLE